MRIRTMKALRRIEAGDFVVLGRDVAEMPRLETCPQITKDIIVAAAADACRRIGCARQNHASAINILEVLKAKIEKESGLELEEYT